MVISSVRVRISEVRKFEHIGYKSIGRTYAWERTHVIEISTLGC